MCAKLEKDFKKVYPSGWTAMQSPLKKKNIFFSFVSYLFIFSYLQSSWYSSQLSMGGIDSPKWKACSQAKSYRSEEGQKLEVTENSNLIKIKKNRPPAVLLLSLQPVPESEKGKSCKLTVKRRGEEIGAERESLKEKLTTPCNRGGSRIFFRRGCTRLLLYLNTNKPHSLVFFAEYLLY